VELTPDGVTLTARSAAGGAICPQCGKVSARVHSSYQRFPHDRVTGYSGGVRNPPLIHIQHIGQSTSLSPKRWLLVQPLNSGFPERGNWSGC
jgi:hypothetical protein